MYGVPTSFLPRPGAVHRFRIERRFGLDLFAAEAAPAAVNGRDAQQVIMRTTGIVI